MSAFPRKEITPFCTWPFCVSFSSSCSLIINTCFRAVRKSSEPPGSIYVEIDDGRSSVVNVIKGPEKIEELKHTYNIDSELKNGARIILEGDKSARIERISGIKSLSLGIPIGVNSAAAEDLEALPGIGDKLARRIIAYRDENGRFKDLGSMLNVNGMGEKKLARIRPFINLD